MKCMTGRASQNITTLNCASSSWTFKRLCLSLPEGSAFSIERWNNFRTRLTCQQCVSYICPALTSLMSRSTQLACAAFTTRRGCCKQGAGPGVSGDVPVEPSERFSLTQFTSVRLKSRMMKHCSVEPPGSFIVQYSWVIIIRGLWNTTMDELC